MNLELPLENLAPPGISGEMIVVEGRKDNSAEDAKKLQDRSERDFEVVCSLSKGIVLSRNITVKPDAETGGSFCVVPKGKSQAFCCPQGTIHTLVNSRREISGFKTVLRSTSLQEARKSFLEVTTPMLDHLSYFANIPLIVDRVFVDDLKNDAYSYNYRSPYPDITLRPGSASYRKEMFPIYGLYREAKNATSDYYKFLCYFKIMEAVFDELRPELFKLARERSVELTRKQEIVPDHSDLVLFQKHLIGRPIKNFLDNDLRPLRDSIAHLLFDKGHLVNPSDFTMAARFSNMILVTELSCRTVVDQQEVYYKQYYARCGESSGT